MARERWWQGRREFLNRFPVKGKRSRAEGDEGTARGPVRTGTGAVVLSRIAGRRGNDRTGGQTLAVLGGR
jgi:hypothetical protein